METLGKLFGSETRVKIMRLFLFNQEKVFDLKTISVRVKSPRAKVRKEISTLLRMKLIKRLVIRKKPKGPGFMLNKDFRYLLQLQNFLTDIEPLHDKELIRRMSKLGTIRLIVISGVFIHHPETRVDILIVGDGMRKSRVERLMKSLEAEIGKELKYAYFSTDDFKYRLGMFDKLVRDILDYPHRKVLNRLTFV